MSERARHAEAVRARAERLFSEEEVGNALAVLSARIRADYRNCDPLVLCVMIGGLLPTSALIRGFDFPFQLDYLHATRYRGETSGGCLVWRARPQAALDGRDVLIVDDILDEGHTLAALTEWCRGESAASVASAVLVEKRHDRKPAGIHADYAGLSVPDRYVFGSGMDYRGYLRNAPGIFALAPEDDP